MTFLKQCAAARECRLSASSSIEDALPLVRSVFEIAPGGAFGWLDTAVVAESIRTISIDSAAKINEVLGRMAGISQGMELGGENDWKKAIKEPQNLSHVLEITRETLAKMEGQALRERIEEAEQAAHSRGWGSCFYVWLFD